MPPSVPSTPPAQTPAETPRKIWTVGTLAYTTTGLVILFCWLLWGDFAWSMKDRAVPPIVQFLLKKFGASDMLAGLLCVSLPAVIGLVLGPIISYKSDRHRGRWGRRIPFLLIPTPIAVLAIAGLAFSPAIGTHLDQFLGPRSWGLNPCILFSLGLFWMLFEFATIIANSIYGALINDVVPQPVLGRFYGLFRALSLLAGIIFNYWIFGKAETAYVWICLGIGALYGVGFTIMCLKVKEGQYPAPPPVAARQALPGFFQNAKIYFRECFGNSYYWWFFGATAVAGLATGPVNLFSIFFATSVDMSLAMYSKCLALTYCISLGLAYPLGWLADKVHPLRIGIAVLALYALVTLWGGLYARDARTFAIALVAHGVIAGIWVTATASLGQRLLPKAEFAQFASAGGIVSSLAWMLLAPVSGFLLDHLHHDYRYTFFFGLGLTLLGLLGCLVLHGKFMALGGPQHYVAPEGRGPGNPYP
ncbi:MAG: MFS transporter [Chthoniobacteraceae bacterium]|nr:MFS transporter [Chthoniobacteraceae bacterium]